MIPIVRLPTVDLCRVVVDTAHIFSDDYVLESIREAQKAMGQDPSVGSALAAFSASIAPVLLGEKYKSSTISILHAMGGSADGGPGNGVRGDSSVLTLPDFIYSTYNSLLEGGWRMHEIDNMDMLGFLRVRAWNAQREQKKKQPQRRCIDEVWSQLKPGM